MSAQDVPTGEEIRGMLLCVSTGEDIRDMLFMCAHWREEWGMLFMGRQMENGYRVDVHVHSPHSVSFLVRILFFF